MKRELERLELITSLYELIELKEKLKTSVMDPMLNWRERMELYQSIQGINERIEHLNKRLKRPSA
ncbi:hypothetical protein [Ammoniphilus sp. YIM 78166]|uniref:hypothetical protein n=1 Tax=Ammoniphilus sp. YIM 78166 TaxID=1644106 RepID=UPI00106F33EF|nr:hypothetical protein [Ammoniphilus sp. YIM 78166]